MSDERPLPAIHDMGGIARFHCTPVEHDEAPPDEFGKQVDALRQVLAQKKLMTVDELRRGIESIPEAEYFTLGYYERWLRSIAGLMVEKGIVDKDILS
jgi:nitrile hydratase